MAPIASTLTPFRICGTVVDSCGDPVSVDVKIELLNPAGGRLIDPTTNGLLTVSPWVDRFDDGCWCTCPLFPNSAADPNQAILPGSTGYQLSVWPTGSINTPLVNETVFLNLEDMQLLPTETSACGVCINVNDMLGKPPVVPPPATFCDAVLACSPASTVVDNGDGTFTHDDGLGAGVVIDVCAAVTASCPTTVVDDGEGSWVVTGTDGVPVTVTDSKSVVVDNGDGTWTHSDGSGSDVVLDVCAANAAGGCLPAVVDNGDGTWTHSDGAGTDVVLDVCAATAAGGCLPSVVNNGDGTYTFDDGHGGSSVIDVNEVDMDINSVTVAGSVLTFTAEDGAAVTVDLCAVVAANCNATLVANPDGSFTFTGNDGSTELIPAAGTPSTLVDNGDGSITHDDGTGTATTVPVCDLLDDLPSSGADLPVGGQVLGDDCEWHSLPAAAFLTNLVNNTLPTSPAGLNPGEIWSDAGVLTVVI